MAIVVQCPKCTKKMNAPDHSAGKRGKCPTCGEAISIPTTAPAIEPIINSSKTSSVDSEIPTSWNAPPASTPRAATSTKPTTVPPVLTEQAMEPQAPTAGPHWAACAFAVLVIMGCFLPWMQLGAMIQNRGIDNQDGAIALVLALGAAGTAAFNLFASGRKIRWPYFVTGLLLLGLATVDLMDVIQRANTTAEEMSKLSRMLGRQGDVSTSQFVGMGLYFVFAGAVGIIISGLMARSYTQPFRFASGLPSTSGSQGFPRGAATLCIECGKYFENEPRFCPNCGKPTRFNK